jgi:hypothetical protein
MKLYTLRAELPWEVVKEEGAKLLKKITESGQGLSKEEEQEKLMEIVVNCNLIDNKMKKEG